MERFKIGDERFYPSPYGDVPGVTTILQMLAKPGLIPWAAGKAVDRMRPFLEMLKAGMVDISQVNIDELLENAKKEHREVKEEAGDTGSRMHEFIANFYRMIRNGAKRTETQMTVGAVIHGTNEPQIEAAWTAFLKWDAKFLPHPVFVEKPVASHHRFAGTLDFFGMMDCDLTIIDFKSAKAVYDETTMQVAAYAMALMETEPTVDRIDRWACLRLDKETGEPEFVEYRAEEISSAALRFIKLVEYWHLTNDWKQRVKGEKREAKVKAKAEKVVPMSKRLK